MKKLLLSFLILCATVLPGCMETTEELTIGADGSGTYHVGMDMSGLFDLMEMMQVDTIAADAMEKKKETLDTVVSMRDFSDTASHLSAEQKVLLQRAKVKMKMDEAAREFKMDMSFPFDKISDVEKLMQLGQNSGGSLAMDKMFKNAPPAEEGSQETLPELNNYFKMVVTGNVIERKLDKDKYNSIKNSDQTKNLQQAGDMLESIKYNTVIHLPRPAKNVTGSQATLSADKKTLTLKNTLQDFYQNPEAFSYRIEY